MNAIGKAILRNITPLLVAAIIMGCVSIQFIFFDTDRFSDVEGKFFFWAMTVPCLVLNLIINLKVKDYKRRMLIQAGVVGFLFLFFMWLFRM